MHYTLHPTPSLPGPRSIVKALVVAVVAASLLYASPAHAQTGEGPKRAALGEDVSFPNGITIANRSGVYLVADDRGQRGDLRRVLILGPNLDEIHSDGVSCRFISPNQRECMMPANGRVVLFNAGAPRPELYPASLQPEPQVEAVGWNPDPLRLDQGEVLALVNDGTVFNGSHQPVVVDDEGEVDGGRRLLVLGAVGVEGQGGAGCSSIAAEVYWECVVPAGGTVLVFTR